MGTKTVKITDERWNSITDFIIAKYPRDQFGKITMIVDVAIKEYLEKNSQSCSVAVKEP